MTSELVDAKWVAPFEAFLADGTALIPGESVVEISRGEAEQSTHWEVVSAGEGPTAKQLRAEAESRGIDVPANASKRQIQKLLTDSAVPAPEATADPEAGES